MSLSLAQKAFLYVHRYCQFSTSTIVIVSTSKRLDKNDFSLAMFATVRHLRIFSRVTNDYRSESFFYDSLYIDLYANLLHPSIIVFSIYNYIHFWDTIFITAVMAQTHGKLLLILKHSLWMYQCRDILQSRIYNVYSMYY